METLSNIIENDEWAGAEGTHKGLPLLIRFRPKLSPALELSAYPQLIQVYWGYTEHPSGMPSPEDSERMEVFEDRLVGALESDLSGLLASVITTNGYREWVLYTKSVDVFSERLHNMPQEEEPYPIQIEADHDPGWTYFFENVRPEQ